MKNSFFILTLSIVLSLPITSWAEVESVDTINEEILTPSQTELLPEKELSDSGTMKPVVKKFLAAMGGVAISSFAIFFLLTVYNRVRENYCNKIKTSEGEVSLETPDDLNDAVRTFLGKTDWK